MLRVRVPSVLPNKYASMVKLADTPDLGSGEEIRAGSSPAGGTKANKQQVIKALEDGNGSHRQMLGDAGKVALPNAKCLCVGKAGNPLHLG